MVSEQDLSPVQHQRPPHKDYPHKQAPLVFFKDFVCIVCKTNGGFLEREGQSVTSEGQVNGKLCTLYLFDFRNTNWDSCCAALLRKRGPGDESQRNFISFFKYSKLLNKYKVCSRDLHIGQYMHCPVLMLCTGFPLTTQHAKCP